MLKKRLNAEEYLDGILAGDKVMLGRAITLIESSLDSDQYISQELLRIILPYSGNSIRIGITGVPGVGKSTFIEVFGKFIIEKESKKIAVLAVDPSSQLTKGSIMGDKTRMDWLSNNSMAYIRPSPSGKTLGGVNKATREAILLCEAAGHEIILIETVGVGQAEISVKGMSDFFLLLMLAGAGDELQGIKKGIIEMADLIAITKADNENLIKAKAAKVVYENALHYLSANENNWAPSVLTSSALANEGIDKIWEKIEEYQSITKLNGTFEKKRNQQNLKWMHETIVQNLEDRFYKDKKVMLILDKTEKEIIEGKLTASQGAMELLEIFLK